MKMIYKRVRGWRGVVDYFFVIRVNEKLLCFKINNKRVSSWVFMELVQNCEIREYYVIRYYFLIGEEELWFVRRCIDLNFVSFYFMIDVIVEICIW